MLKPTTGVVFLAVASHLVFKRWEPCIFQFAGVLALLQCILYWSLAFTYGLAGQQLVTAMVQYNALYVSALGASVAAYRLYLHPLRNYPGPICGRLTKLCFVYHCRHGKSHLWLEFLHQKYGEVVRYGPNELSFINPEAVADIQGGRATKVRRGPWYDGSPDHMQESLSMASTRNVEAHKFRRRIWEQGFTQSALLSYEPKLVRLIDHLTERCMQNDGQIFDLKMEVDNFAFDAMGLVGFSRDYGMVSGLNHESKEQMGSLSNYMKMLGTTRPIPWFKHVYRILPLDTDGIRGFMDITMKRFRERYQEGASITDDILYYLMLPESKSGEKITHDDLFDEAVSVVVAGSDTTSICLSYAMYYLLRDRRAYEELFREIEALWDGSVPLEAKNLVPARAPYLDGVINESLRLAEPDPNGNQRQTPKGGLMVCNEHIPEQTQLSVHKWSMQRYERNFSKAHQFIPERWISQEERDRRNITNHKTKGFIPFGAGQYGCVGKQLALSEMRLFLVGFLRRLDIVPSPAYDLEHFPRETRSHLTLITPSLPAIVKRRQY